MANMNINTATLEQLEDECANVVGTGYGHNIISLICNVVEKRFGEEEAERFFETYQM